MERTDFFRIFLILFLIILDLFLLINSKNLNCDKCQIKFTVRTEVSKEIQKDSIQMFKENITNLYNSYINNKCLVQWSEENGVYFKNNSAIF